MGIRTLRDIRTMRDISRETRQGTADIGGLAERLETIQNEFRVRINEAKRRMQNGEEPSFNKGFNISIGGCGLGNAGSARGRQSNEESTPIHMIKPQKKNKAASVSYAPEIKLQSEIIRDYDSNGGLGVILVFQGISFSDGAFIMSRETLENNALVCYAPVKYDNKDAFLKLSSIEDILEIKVAPQKDEVERMFGHELYIPELTGYNASSMEAVKNNGIVLVSYKKQQAE